MRRRAGGEAPPGPCSLSQRQWRPCCLHLISQLGGSRVWKEWTWSRGGKDLEVQLQIRSGRSSDLGEQEGRSCWYFLFCGIGLQWDPSPCFLALSRSVPAAAFHLLWRAAGRRRGTAFSAGGPAPLFDSCRVLFDSDSAHMFLLRWTEPLCQACSSPSAIFAETDFCLQA